MRSILVVGVLVLLFAGATLLGLRLPAVQEFYLSHADLPTLADRVVAQPTNWRAQYWYARRSIEAGDLPNAERALRTILGSRPDDERALTELGKVVLAQHRVEEAFQLLRMAAGRDPRSVEPRVALAFLYRAQGATDRAIAVSTEALKLEPDNVRALYELGSAQTLVQQFDNAENTLRHAVRVAPGDAPSLVELSRVLFRKRKADEAEALARQALKLDAGNVDAQLALAQVLARKEPLAENRKEALRLLRHARDLAPGRDDVPMEAAQILTASGNWAEAESALSATIRLNPDLTEAYLLMARTEQQVGHTAESRRMTDLFQRKSAYDRAVNDLRDQLGANPESAELRFKLAEVHVAAGHPERAVPLYRSGLQRDPRNAEARARLSRLLSQAAAR